MPPVPFGFCELAIQNSRPDPRGKKVVTMDGDKQLLIDSQVEEYEIRCWGEALTS
jgi:hypothetical protein